ncbi:MAG: hypothetical protein HC884_11965 [Chloroflexaceae bacterium]|nr:hypothetical protein [Chloroflexaceae bacterium]
MSYRDFTLSDIEKQFTLTIDETTDLYSSVREMPISDSLKAILDEQVPLALAISTEKARSELIIAPLLVELRKMVNHQISLFSGVDFTVDSSRGLSGVCDFIVSGSRKQFVLDAPVLIIIEAKNESIPSGLGQCVAQMIAAQLFNEHQGNPIKTVHGAVTTGSVWRFLRLRETTLWIDCLEYYINTVGRILAILLSIVESKESIS